MQETPQYTEYEQSRIYSISKQLIIAEKKQLNKNKLTWCEIQRIYNMAVDKMEDEKLPRCHRCDRYSDEPLCSIKCKKDFERQQEEDNIKWVEFRKWWDNLSTDEKYNVSETNQLKYKQYLLNYL
jgi:hypothetical protein